MTPGVITFHMMCPLKRRTVCQQIPVAVQRLPPQHQAAKSLETEVQSAEIRGNVTR